MFDDEVGERRAAHQQQECTEVFESGKNIVILMREREGGQKAEDSAVENVVFNRLRRRST